MKPTSSSILVIDDDQSILEVIRLVLEQAEYQVFTSNQPDILPLIKKHQPSLVLIDNWLHGGKDGIQSVNQIKSQYKNLPIMMMSANPEVRPLAEAAGVDAFIDKPFDIDQLTETIATIIK